jgi:hypothetical protein
MMKKHIKTIIALLTFLGFWGGVWAQIDLQKNEDGSVNKEIIIANFEKYLDTVGQLPDIDTLSDTDKEKKLDTFVVNFLLQIFPSCDEIKIVKEGDNWLTNELCCIEMKTMVRNEIEQRKHEAEIKRLLLLAGLGVVGLLVIIIILVFIGKRKKRVKPTLVQTIGKETDIDDSNIVIRHKTTAIQRKQNIDDVIGNDNYMEIDCNSFVDDSAVKQVYIKTACIKEIYNMYANDLRNPENPKEDGCMVLGRWVQDKKANDYYVTLEHVVLPGNDAVFTEYELNFGGKIKMDVREKLKKLRVETDIQYDLTCWVHSHPGLGVFFSNNDCSVQNLLKHPSHPNFLTALVVDILTPQQEMGLFTFKHDGTINSRIEMKQLFSLEEWYQWAVEQERNSFNAEDYRNGLERAKQRSNNCHGIELSNGAIIDMGLLAVEHSGELVSTVYGYPIERKDVKEYVVVKVTDDENVVDCNPIGAFVMVTHCSIPSVKKAIAQQLGDIKFVLVYSTSDGLLTSIPIIDGNLCTDENYYGEQQLEDLKIWTRRKR